MIRLGPGHYFGLSLGTRRLGSLTLTTTRYRAGDVLPRHCHEQPYLFVTLAGATKERALRRDHVCTRGWLIYNEAGEAHHDQVLDSGAEGVNIEFSPEWLSRVRAESNGREPVLYRHAGAALAAVGVLEVAMQSRDPLRALRAEEAVAVLMGSMHCPPQRRGPAGSWMQRVEGAVHDTAGRIPALGALSDIARVHPGHLCREFRRVHGCTISDYAARVRADLALTRVMRTSRSLAAVSAETGYADQAHLTRSFRRYFGTTPGRIRSERAGISSGRAN